MIANTTYYMKENTRTYLSTPDGARSAWYELLDLPSELKLDREGFAQLWQQHPEKLGQIKLFGKMVDTPRYQQNYGTPYYYSGVLHQPQPIKPDSYLAKVQAWVQAHSRLNYQQLLANYYRDGQDYISMHSDSEAGLVPGAPIYSISLGATRPFVLQSIDRKTKVELTLSDGQVLIMGGTLQTYYKHGLPKRKRITQPRINLTLRLMQP